MENGVKGKPRVPPSLKSTKKTTLLQERSRSYVARCSKRPLFQPRRDGQSKSSKRREVRALSMPKSQRNTKSAMPLTRNPMRGRKKNRGDVARGGIIRI